MRLDNINLNNIKVAIFDFDETLAIHKDKDFTKHRSESEESFSNWYYNAYKNPNIFYEEIEPCTKSELLYKFINNLRNKKIKMYCLSGMKFSFHLKAKQAFIDKYYGNDIEVISTTSQELKLKGVKIIAKINNCELNEILFIDDNTDVITLLEKNGVKSLLVNDIEL